MASELLQKIQGAILGHALGDALGAPHEFKPYGEYSGRLEVPIIRIPRGKSKETCALGQVTDDTEMAMALLWSLEGGFSEERTIKEYLAWAHSGCPFLGANTRDLFLGKNKKVNTLQKYRKEYANKFSNEADRENNQSNGVLMRGYVLAFIKPEVVARDVSLTNPSQIAVQAVEIYTSAIRMALMGFTKQEIMDESSNMITHEVLRTAFDSARNNQFRNVTQSRGWVTHAFYCAFWGFANFDNYASAVDAIICLSPEDGVPAKICKRQGVRSYRLVEKSLGDTDTNAAIAGALLGAYYGIRGMCADPVTTANMQVLIRTDPGLGATPRPDRYTMNWNNFLTLSGIAYNLFKQNFGIPGAYAPTSPSPVPEFSSDTDALEIEAEKRRLMDAVVQQDAMDRQQALVAENQRILENVAKQKDIDRQARLTRERTTAKREDVQARQVAEFLEVPIDTQEVVQPPVDIFEFSICLGLIPQ
jgi:ADP-ribosyl-[dinitrogen reductase] hydrolase